MGSQLSRDSNNPIAYGTPNHIGHTSLSRGPRTMPRRVSIDSTLYSSSPGGGPNELRGDGPGGSRRSVILARWFSGTFPQRPVDQSRRSVSDLSTVPVRCHVDDVPLRPLHGIAD